MLVNLSYNFIKKEVMDKFDRYIKELLKWNKTHKLTNYNEDELKEQIEYTLYPIKKENLTPKEGIDIGTGAGLPGIVLAIAMPNTKWYLVEPLKKRYSFLNYLKVVLGLDNVEVIPKRIEDANLPKVDLITSRAVASTKELFNLAKPYLKKEGVLLLYKGERRDEIGGVDIKTLNKDKFFYLFLKERGG